MTAASIRSVPALAAGLREIDRCALPTSTAAAFGQRPLVPLYQVANGSLDREVAAAARTVVAVADKLRRLASAYGQWEHFDVSAFFDLWPEQAHFLVHVVERVSTAHVTFYADLLLPSFQRVETYWAAEFFPSYQTAHPFPRRRDRRSSYTEHFLEIEQPKMIAYWERLLQVVRAVQTQLSNDIAFLATAGGSDEQAHWQLRWPEPAARGLDERLLPQLQEAPTLTLAIEFPLPAHRQPGRIRRLRRMWRRKDWRRR